MQRIIPCKICEKDATFNGYADFAKSCEINRGHYLGLTGWPVKYYRCTSCGFLFTIEFDHYTLEDWKKMVYNDQYHLVDPDYADGSRACKNAEAVRDFLRINGPRCLDYGGGDGMFAKTIRDQGIDCVSWDMLVDGALDAVVPFDVVTAFEVLEHTPTPIDTMQEILRLLKPNGHFLFSTLTLDLQPQQMDHWYIAPANGHVSIHTIKSLDTMFWKAGRHLHHYSASLHLAMPKRAPATT